MCAALCGGKRTRPAAARSGRTTTKKLKCLMALEAAAWLCQPHSAARRPNMVSRSQIWPRGLMWLPRLGLFAAGVSSRRVLVLATSGHERSCLAAHQPTLTTGQPDMAACGRIGPPSHRCDRAALCGGEARSSRRREDVYFSF